MELAMIGTSHSVAIVGEVDCAARSHLIRDDGQEDLCFALWYPSYGGNRTTALMYKLILPNEGDRDIHGNVSFQPRYFERALDIARREKAGLAFLHSHPTAGWQDMSYDDICAEQGHAGATWGVTNLPLVGLTVGSDGAWSARFWERLGPKSYQRKWCRTVRIVGEQLKVTYMDELAPRPQPREILRRTISAWGIEAQEHLARLHVGIVGAGSVGAIIGEALARTGFETVTAIDFDCVETHNLDRLLHATAEDAANNRLKVELLEEFLYQHATAENFSFNAVAKGINDDEGYQAALDCDVLISCVDRPWARHILNYIAYAHLIPVTDGGISVRSNRHGEMVAADWRAHVATVGRRCLQCIGQYDPGSVELDRMGLLDDPSYIEKLPHDHPLRNNENIFTFSLSCAGLMLQQMLMLVIAPLGVSNPGSQLYHFVPGFMEEPKFDSCEPNCQFRSFIGRADTTGATVIGPRVLRRSA